MNFEQLLNTRVPELMDRYPFLPTFFAEHALDTETIGNRSFSAFLESLDEESIEDQAIDKETLSLQFVEFIEQMSEFLGQDAEDVTTLTILPGQDKNGDRERFRELEISRNEITCIVGPTGSGKSRLLADIEWVACGDTPTRRTILINGNPPDKKWRLSSAEKLVAQLSQNMNFVMDLSVAEFLDLHAESRLVEDKDAAVREILHAANLLAGERFELNTPITSLSGGQSRALMIADTAILSKSPVILIDEIENAGIDRKRALELLLAEDKIVLMATHDPILALMGHRRIVIRNGGIHEIIKTTPREKEILRQLEDMDKKFSRLRKKLRNGETLDTI